MLEAVDYYRTPRGQHEGASNQLRFRSVASVLAFDAFHLAEELLTQPLQIIVGNRAGGFGSYQEGRELFRRATSEKDLLVIDGASHYDLYDQWRCLKGLFNARPLTCTTGPNMLIRLSGNSRLSTGKPET
jgi:hypothetical protein